jgi:hypothetical protein
MDQDDVLEDMRKVAKFGTVILWSEVSRIFEGRDRNPSDRYLHALHKALPAQHWIHLFAGEHETPISIQRRRRKITKSGSVRLHDGKANASPARHDCWVHTEELERPEVELGIHDTHYVSAAFNDVDRPHKDWRRNVWPIGHRVHSDLVRAGYDAGRTQVGGGDFNRRLRDIPLFHPRMRWHSPTGGIMGIWTLEAPGGARVTEVGRDELRLNSDHDALMVELRLDPPDRDERRGDAA